jgi:hypothetical protein
MQVTQIHCRAFTETGHAKAKDQTHAAIRKPRVYLNIADLYLSLQEAQNTSEHCLLAFATQSMGVRTLLTLITWSASQCS